MHNARLWFARLVMSASGVPESINFLRTGPGALFLGMTLFAADGLARPGRLRTCLWVLVVMNACVVAVRLLGIAVDGVSPLQLSELRDEGVSWLLFVAALVACPRTVGRTVPRDAV